MADINQLLQFQSPSDNLDNIAQRLLDSEFSFTSLSSESPLQNPPDTINWNDILQTSSSPASDLVTPNLSPFNSPPSIFDPIFQTPTTLFPPQKISFTGNPLTSNIQQIQLQQLQQNLLQLQQQRHKQAEVASPSQTQLSEASLQSLIVSVAALNNQLQSDTNLTKPLNKTKAQKARSSESDTEEENTTKTTKRRKNMTTEEKEEKQRERILRNRAAAQESRDKKRRYMEELEAKNRELTKQNLELAQRLAMLESMAASGISNSPITPPQSANGATASKGPGSPGLFNFTLGQIGDSAAVSPGTRTGTHAKLSVSKSPTTLFSGDHMIMPSTSPQRMLSTSSWSPETISAENSYILNAPNRGSLTLPSAQSKSLVQSVKFTAPNLEYHPVSTSITPSSMDQQTTFSTGSSILVQSSQHPLTAIVATGIIQSMIYWVVNSRRMASQRQSVYNPWTPSYLLPKWMAGSNITTFNGSFRTSKGEMRQYQGLLFVNRVDSEVAYSAAFNGSKIGANSAFKSYYSVGLNARINASRFQNS